MHAFFKPALILFFFIFLFFYIFSNSNTLETTTEVYQTSTGMPQQRTNYIFHWDRFYDYIVKTPDRIKQSFNGS
ncbi:MAG: hypothetical protein AB1403_07530 [Candidatus Riflebacteria bacterium]